MKLFVCIKQVPDTETKIKVKPDSSGIDPTGVKWILNPYDEYAVEEAVKAKEAGKATAVTVVCVGPKARIVESLRTALAMGADDAIAIDAPESLDASTTAEILAAAIKAEGEFGAVFTGKMAIDDGLGAVSQMLADKLDIPHAVGVTKLDFGEKFVAERELEGGAKEVLEVNKPAVIGANKGLNMPRYPSLPGIMKAKKKPIKDLTADGLGISIDANTKYKFSQFRLPAEKPAIKMIDGDAATQAKALASLLRQEAKVL